LLILDVGLDEIEGCSTRRDYAVGFFPENWFPVKQIDMLLEFFSDHAGRDGLEIIDKDSKVHIRMARNE
jgi:hypothetical protein